MNSNSKRRGIVAFVLCLILSLSGCVNGSKQETTTPNDPNAHPPGAVAMLINLPTEAERSEYTIKGTLELQKTDESVIFVALEDGTSLNIVEIEMQENGELIDKKTAYSFINVSKNFAIEFKAFRPEGAPYYKLVISVNGFETIYYISYNGKDGNPKIEYIY